MILSDREIKAAIARGALKLTPDPPTEAWSSTAVDLRLAPELVLWKRPGGAGVEAVVCPAHAEYSFDTVRDQYSQRIEIAPDGYVFKPGTFLLGWTQEKIQLPHRSRLAARVEGKSSLARLGIGVHVTAPTIHAGFGFKKGDDSYPGTPLQLEMWNVGPLDVKLAPGMAICQIIFELVDGTPEKGYEGRFSIQGPVE
ncbi:MAG TPA: dCTP deaminase [Planctomycetaceae bacterium]|nr:dCTP deaminase [Planctomycetaceae bacterium]